MSNLQAILAAKAAAASTPVPQNSSMATQINSQSPVQAQSGIPSPTVQNLSAKESEIQTGIESVTLSPDTKNDPSPVSMVDAPLDDRYKDYPEHSFLMIRQKNLIARGGAKIKPDKNGVITAKDEDQFKRLRYLEEQNTGLVRRIA